jgi:hypothetical protein
MRTQISHEFVDTIPEHLEDDVVYVSIPFATAVHRCCCGCGHEVVTPLHPRRWSLIFDGETISLTPSIGNWSFPCRSHYWIRAGRIHTARSFTDAEVTDVRAEQDTLLQDHYTRNEIAAVTEAAAPDRGWWRKSARWLKSRFQ